MEVRSSVCHEDEFHEWQKKWQQLLSFASHYRSSCKLGMILVELWCYSTSFWMEKMISNLLSLPSRLISMNMTRFEVFRRSSLRKKRTQNLFWFVLRYRTLKQDTVPTYDVSIDPRSTCLARVSFVCFCASTTYLAPVPIAGSIVEYLYCVCRV